MKYYTRDGELLKGTTARDILIALRGLALFKSRDLETYMQKAAKFAGYISGREIRSADANDLLDDLIGAKFVLTKGEVN